MSDNRILIAFRVNTDQKQRLDNEAAERGLKTNALAKLRALQETEPAEPRQGAAAAEGSPGGPAPRGDEVEPTEDEMKALGEQIRREEAGEAEPPAPDLESRETFLRFLYERNTELHRDKQKRWPGVKARRKSGEEWKLVREGKPLEKIEPRELPDAIQVIPTTYRTA